MERFEKFPLTTEQLEMLLAGNTCDPGPFYSTFGFTPFALSDYLSGGRKVMSSPVEGSIPPVAKDTIRGEPKSQTEDRNPHLRKSA
jgi:hypothetical protein